MHAFGLHCPRLAIEQGENKEQTPWKTSIHASHTLF
jgi:hypothetical protein